MLRLITGSCQQERENCIFAEIQQVLEQGGHPVLLVPEQFTLAMERQVARYFRGKPHKNLEVLSFDRLGHRLVDNRRGLGLTPVDPVGRLMAFQKAVLACREQLTAYRRIAGRPAFAMEADRMYRQLKFTGITGEAMVELGQKTAQQPLLAQKLQDLNRIFAVYEGWLENRYLDEADRIFLLNGTLAEERPFQGKSLWIHGFRSFTALEWQLMETLARQAAGITLSLDRELPGLEDAPLFAPIRQTRDRFVRMAEQEGQLAEKTVEPDGRPWGQRVGAQVFGTVAPQAPSVPGVFWAHCGDPEQEAALAARRILDWVRQKGWRWNEVLLITPGDEGYTRLIQRVFRRYGVPVFVDSTRSLASHGLCRFVLEALRAADGRLDGESVCAMLKWGYLEDDRSLLDQLENYVLARGIRGRRWRELAAEGGPELESLMLRTAERVESLSKAFRGSLQAATCVEALSAFLEAAGVRETLELRQQELQEAQQWEAMQEQAQIWNRFTEVLEQIRGILGDTELELPEFARILKTGLEAAEVGVIPPVLDAVSMGTLYRSRSGGVKGLVLLGANDGLLPAYSSGDDLFLNDEKLFLKELGLDLASDQESRAREEEYALYEMLSRVEAELLITCSVRSRAGEAMTPSWPFETLTGIGTRWLGRDGDAPGYPADAVGRYAAALRQGRPVPRRERLLLDHLGRLPEWKPLLDQAEAGHRHRYQAAPLAGETVEALYGTGLTMNATGVEHYGRCPFAWYVRHGLKPQPRRTFQVTVPDLGILFHTCVDRFVRQCRQERLDWAGWTAEEIGQKLDPIVEELAAQYGWGVLESSARNRFLKAKIRRLGLRALLTLGRHLQAGTFRIERTELAFSPNPEWDSLPPLVLETEDGRQLVVQGRIDRVDLCTIDGEPYARIIDYKSGRPKFSLSDFVHGLELQLAVYLDAVDRGGARLAGQPVVPAGFLYFYLDDPLVEQGDDNPQTAEQAVFRNLRMEGLLLGEPAVLEAMDSEAMEAGASAIIPVSVNKDGSFGKRSSVLSRADLKALLQYGEGIIRSVGESILEGQIAVQPCRTESDAACDRCDYRGVCQFDLAGEGDGYRLLKKLEPEAALERIRKEGTAHE